MFLWWTWRWALPAGAAVFAAAAASAGSGSGGAPTCRTVGEAGRVEKHVETRGSRGEDGEGSGCLGARSSKREYVV